MENDVVSRTASFLTKKKKDMGLLDELSAQTDIPKNEIKKEALGVESTIRGASVALEEGKNPQDLTGQELKQKDPLAELQAFKEKSDAEAKEEDAKANKQKLIATAFLNTLPTLLGGVFGGAEGASIGAQAGLKGTDVLESSYEKSKKEAAEARKDSFGKMYETVKQDKELQAKALEKKEERDFQKAQDNTKGAREMSLQKLKLDREEKLALAKNQADIDKIEKEYNNKAGLIAYESQFKDKKEKDKVAVPGFIVADNARPTEKDAEEIKKLNQSRYVVNESVNELVGLLTKYGPESYGKIADKMRQLYTDIELEQKNINNLGVLAGPDMELITNIVPDPTKFFSKKGTVIELLNNVKKAADRKVGGAANSRGFIEANKVEEIKSNQNQQMLLGEMNKADAWLKKNPNDKNAANVAAHLANLQKQLQEQIAR